MDTFEDIVYSLAERALTEKFKQLVEEKEDLIKDIMNEIFTEKLAKEWIKDYVQYNEDFRKKIFEIIADDVTAKFLKVLE
jgi:DNA-binding GntR family transcriptional regulator